MEVLATLGSSLLSGVIDSVIQNALEKSTGSLGGSKSQLSAALQDLKTSLSLAKQLVVDAEKQVHINDDNVLKYWVASVRDVTYDADKVLDKLEYKQLKRMNAESNLASFYHKNNPFQVFTKKIIAEFNEIQERLKLIVEMGKTYKLSKSSTDIAHSQVRIPTCSVPNAKDVIGRDSIIEKIVQQLTEENHITNDRHDIGMSAKRIPIFPIVGIGGIGKTTVAQMVINHEKVRKYFDLKIWVCVSDEFDEKKIILQILDSVYFSKRSGINKEGETMKFDIGNVAMRQCDNLELLINTLGNELKGKRYFLVLDDVWNEEPGKWEIIENCLQINDENKGSKILVTTRSKRVAKIMSSITPIYLDGLTGDVFWSLFQKYAFDTTYEYPPELEEIAKKIMSKLHGSPLAAKTIGRILRIDLTKRHWENVLHSEMWTLTQKMDDIMPALRLSYQYLPEYLKPCFAFCSLYPTDYVYDKEETIRMWISLGYVQNQHKGVIMEEIGERYVKELLERSMFQPCTENDVSDFVDELDDFGLSKKIDVNDMFKMHDLIHDLAKMVSENESVVIKDENALKDLPSSIRNVSIFIDNKDWSWNKHGSYDHLKNIRALIFLTKDKLIRKCSSSISAEFCDFLQKIVSKMEFLRVLDLSYIEIEDLALPKLKHLRYLDVYGTGVKKLPGSLAQLYQLQVLNCDDLESAPQINSMANLRHISGFHVNTDAVPNLENFHFLQELKLDVSKQNKLLFTKEKSNHKLIVLRGMKWMQELSIYELENVESKEEALEAELKSMDRLTKLTLTWESDPKGNDVEDILEALHPGANVSTLKINNYNGRKCPSWMANLLDLQELHLKGCENIKFIDTRELKKIKYLRLLRCSHLRVKDGREGFCGLTSLERLVITNCSQLIVDLFTEGRGGLPSSLKEICFGDSNGTVVDVASNILQSLTNLTDLNVGSLSGGSITPSPRNPPETQQLQQLTMFALVFTSAEQLKGWLLHLQGCTSLVVIILKSDGSGLEVFDTEMENALVSFVSLRDLLFVDFEECRSLPTTLCEISSLKQLGLESCPKVVCLPEKGLPSGLQVLQIDRCPLLKEHAEKVRHLLPKQLEVTFL